MNRSIRMAVVLATIFLAGSSVSTASAYQGCGCGMGDGTCACGTNCQCGTIGDGGGETLGGNFASSNIELLSQLTISQMGAPLGIRGASMWGWVDPSNSREYALVGRSDGTSFVDVTDPYQPQHVGFLPRHGSNPITIWRDVKVYQNHAFIVSDAASSHGMQVFDLTRLRGLSGPPAMFTEDAHYSGFGSAHTLAINEETGFAYAAGTSQRGLHIVDVRNPLQPVFAGHASTPSYTHETQVVVYHGPDATYANREIALSSTVDTFTIHDLSNKSSPSIVSRTGYPGASYSHQGWLTEDQRYFLMNDELDEINFGHNTRTRVWDVQDLNAPEYLGYYEGPNGSIDHNLYVRGEYVYLSNYTTGLRVVRLHDVAGLDFEEVGFFDTYLPNDSVSFNGAWTSYPYFPSGNVIVNDINSGLFVLSTVRIPGDGNWDGHVAGSDYTLWANGFGLFNGNATPADGDFNGDGFVTGADYTRWADNFGHGPLDDPSSLQTTIAEPFSGMLLAIGGSLLALRRRRR